MFGAKIPPTLALVIETERHTFSDQVTFTVWEAVSDLGNSYIISYDRIEIWSAAQFKHCAPLSYSFHVGRLHMCMWSQRRHRILRDGSWRPK